MQATSPNPSKPVSTAGDIVYPWVPDQGDGTFRNPIIFADYSDADVVRAGEDFYMVASSFTNTPGLPLLHSRDLVNWTLINHAIKNLPHPRFAEVRHGCGVWAPAIRFHQERFWIFFPMPDEGIYVTTATDPAGTWSEPHLLQAGKGLIDPCPLWDDDGQAYLVHAYAGSRAGIKHRLRVCPMAPDASRLLGEGHIVFHEPEKHPTLEGPKFLKKDGWYYILAPAGGVSTGWQVALRSRGIYGPYEDKVVLAQGSTPVNGPHQGALVDFPGRGWWFIHFQCADVYGRVLHLQPVEWRDGWPLMGRRANGNDIGEPVLEHSKPNPAISYPIRTPATSDEFDSPNLGLQWQWQANHQPDWSIPDPTRSRLRLQARPVAENNLLAAQHLLLQKFPARSFMVETLVELDSIGNDQEAGIVIMGSEYACLALQRRRGQTSLILRFKDSEAQILHQTGSSLKLRVTVQDGALCLFAHEDHGRWQTLEQTFQAVKGTWIGAKIGLYALGFQPGNPSGYAEFDYFRFHAPQDGAK
jgi:beta-xylosidase